MGLLRPLKETVVSHRVKKGLFFFSYSRTILNQRELTLIMLSYPKQYIYGQKVRPKSAPSTTKQDNEHPGDFKMGVPQPYKWISFGFYPAV